jgi:ubiquitin-conjugating enzyme E2 J1
MATKNLSSSRIIKELKDLKSDPPENFIVFVDNENLHEWFFTIKGTPDSPYAGGLYHGKIILPSDYPLRAPDLIFLTVSLNQALMHKLIFFLIFSRNQVDLR